MRKVFFILAVALLLIQSCGKMEENQKDQVDFNNRIIPLETSSKGTGYLLVTTIGHLSSDCGGHCITIAGIPLHVDCMGEGHVCRQATAIAINQTGTEVTATTLDTFGLTSEDFFLMPSRSFYYVDGKGSGVQYLNIPSQLLFRDTATHNFTFTGLFFSTTPMYSNN